MLDLADIFKTGSKKENAVKTKVVTGLIVSPDNAFVEFLCELYAVEGVDKPEVKAALKESDIAELSDECFDLLYLDLREDTDLFAYAELVANLLAKGIKLVVIGKQDSIVISRDLAKKGIDYIYWPAEEMLFVDLIRAPKGNQVSGLSSYKGRCAKRIAIVSTKGGVGNSLIASGIALSLAEQAKVKTLLVDNAYYGTNTDIYLGLKTFSRHSVMFEDVKNGIDSTVAKSMISTVSANLDLLAVNHDSAKPAEIHGVSVNVVHALSMQYNFIIDDISLPLIYTLGVAELSNLYDRIIFVCEPSITSLRTLKKFKQAFAESHAVIDVVINSNKAASEFPLSIADMRLKIEDEVIAVFPFDSKIKPAIINNSGLSKCKSKLNEGFEPVFARLTGKIVKSPVSKGKLNRWWNRNK